MVDLVDEYSPRSLIVFTSEHGDLGGAHGLPYKGPAMYEELIRVPLVISWPDQILVGESDALVSSIDLLPTLCDLAGLIRLATSTAALFDRCWKDKQLRSLAGRIPSLVNTTASSPGGSQFAWFGPVYGSTCATFTMARSYTTC